MSCQGRKLDPGIVMERRRIAWAADLLLVGVNLFLLVLMQLPI
jgi:hypothetical protein